MSNVKNLKVDKINGVIEELQAYIEQIERDLNDAKKNLKVLMDYESGENMFGFFKPDRSETYYYINNVGETDESINAGVGVDDECIKHIVFKTREDAKFYAERLKVIRQLDHLVDVGVDDIYVDYYEIIYDEGIDELYISKYSGHRNNLHLFKTEERAWNAINIVGEDRLKKYYFLAGGEDE